MNEIHCERCGRCCHYWKDGVLTKCKHLVYLPSGKTLCRNWKGRIGSIIDKNKDGKKVICIWREESMFNYEGCPFNVLKPEQPMFPNIPVGQTQCLNNDKPTE